MWTGPVTNVGARKFLRPFSLTVAQTIALYGILVTLFLGAADYFYARAHFPPIQPTQAGTNNLINKRAWYELHVNDYNLVFIGDSKTYCGIHPELLDPLLGTRSLNLAIMAHWFPTQLPLVQDIAPLIPKGTTVVWSLGHVNFVHSTGVGRVYPVGINNALRYLAWGIPNTGIMDNVFYYNPALYFLSQREEIRRDLANSQERPLDLSVLGATRARAASNESETFPVSDDDVRREKETFEKDPDVFAVVVVKDEGKPTSLTVYFQRGSYYRVELDRAYFRRKQQMITGRFDNPQIDKPLWYIFEEILRTFKANGVNVIVNELEETPFMYGGNQAKFRKFMQETVQKKVEEYGFPYIRVDFDKLTDEDYFDYNHLNSLGAKTFTPMLAEQLRPHLQSRKLSSRSQPASAR